MKWSKLDSTLPRHRKVVRLSKLLNCKRVEAIGLVVSLWAAAMDLEPDGDLSEWQESEIAEACFWRGVPNKLVQALVKSGFIDNGQGMVLHDWMAYQGSYRKALSKRSERQRSTSGTTVARRSSDSRPERRGEEKRGDERRGEEHKSLTTLAPTVQKEWGSKTPKELARAILAHDERTRGTDRLPRLAPAALFSSTHKIGRVVNDVEMTRADYARCVEYHQTATFGVESRGYKQSWPAFANSFDALWGEVRRSERNKPKVVISRAVKEQMERG